MVRRFGNPVITNPDMLHIGLLPNHPRWAEFLAGLTHVVVDEAHAYRGVFGSHVACVLRRLRRVCALYGSEPQFLLASATVANPAEAAAALTGLEVEVIDEDTAPRAERTVAFWQPILLDEASGERASALGEAAVLLATLVGRGLRTICFTKSRKGTELVYRLARDRLTAAGLEEAAERLAPYRAGYTAEVRRAIEADLVSGALLGVVATEALELGIDVGLLDCAITTGFPGTVASLRQQWGRAGRRDAGLAVFVPSEDGLDQFFARHPEALLERRVEAVIMDAPTPRSGSATCGPRPTRFPSPRRTTPCSGRVPTRRPSSWPPRASCSPVSPGSCGGAGVARCGRAPALGGTATVVVVEAGTGAMLGTVDEMRAVSTLHDGRSTCTAASRTWLSPRPGRGRGPGRALRRALVHAAPPGDRYADPAPLEGPRRRAGVDLSYGEVEVTDQWSGTSGASCRATRSSTTSSGSTSPSSRFRTPRPVVRAAG